MDIDRLSEDKRANNVIRMNTSTELNVVGNVTATPSNVSFDWNGSYVVTTPELENDEQDIKLYPEYIVAYYINRIYLWIVLSVGVPGNIAALFTFIKMHPFTSSNMYMCALAVFDSLTIIFKVLYIQLTIHDISLTDAGCKLTTFSGTFSMHFANWILVAMTIERFIAIWFPLRVANVCTVKRSVVVMLIIGGILAGINMHFLWTYTEKWNAFYKYYCVVHDMFVKFEDLIWYWIDGSVYSIVPTIILLVFNSLIIFGIQKSGRRQRRLTNKIDRTQITDKQKQQRQVTVMLVTLSVVFIILTTPNCVFFILKEKWDYKVSNHSYAKYILLSQVIFRLSDTNHAVNFYLYFLSGRKFRQHFLQLICFCRKKRPLLRSETTMSNINSTSSIRGSSTVLATSVSTISNGYAVRH